MIKSSTLVRQGVKLGPWEGIEPVAICMQIVAGSIQELIPTLGNYFDW